MLVNWARSNVRAKLLIKTGQISSESEIEDARECSVYVNKTASNKAVKEAEVRRMIVREGIRRANETPFAATTNDVRAITVVMSRAGPEKECSGKHLQLRRPVAQEVVHDSLNAELRSSK